MIDVSALAIKYTDALAAQDSAALETELAEQVMLRRWQTDGLLRFRGRNRVVECFKAEWANWSNAKFSLASSIISENKIALEYRYQVVEHGRLVEYNRAEFVTFADDLIQTIDTYLPDAIPSGPRGDTKIANIDESQVNGLLDSLRYSHDLRGWMSPDMQSLVSLRGSYFASSQAHPGVNFVYGARWNEQDADALIKKQIDLFGARGLGFCWYVSPLDTPRDLGERLAAHGLVLAGHAATMVRIGLDSVGEIPGNAELDVITVPHDRPDLYDQALQVGASGFSIPPQVLERMRNSWRERAQKPELAKLERTYLAQLNGKAVGYAVMKMEGGVHAYLGGAATLPEFRGRKIYSTLLRKRLEDARALGFQIATIDAEPMSRRVVTRYGFKEYGKIAIYAWMPVMDMNVIKQLVPDE